MKQSIKDGTVLYGGRDIAGVVSEVRNSASVETEECHTLASEGWQEMVGTTKNASWNLQTYRENTPEPDLSFFDLGGVVPVAATLTRPPQGGDVVYLQRCVKTSYEQGGEVGKLSRLSVQMDSNRPMARGGIIDSLTDVNASAISAVFQLAAPVGKRMVATLHLLKANGTLPTLDGTLERDATAVAAFDQLTSLGDAAYLEFVATSADMYRLNFTVGGTGPDLDFVIAVGIAG